MANNESTTKEMLPEVREYIEATEAADKTWREEYEALDVKYPKRNRYVNWEDDSEEAQEVRKQIRAYRDERIEASDKFAEAHASAWKKLAQSSDPLVAWIAKECEHYKDHALAVLQALPATVEELDELASDNGWCEVWDHFRDRAEEAGVLPGSKPATPARQAINKWLRDEYCMGIDSRKELNRLLEALVKETRDLAKAEGRELETVAA